MASASADAGAQPAAGLWSPARRQLTVGLLLTITLVAFESLAVATVMPDVKDDLGGLALYGWVFSGFFLASLLGIVVSGRLADERGLALPFTAGLVLFSAGLVVGGLAGSMPVLVAGRIAQGFGAGAIPATAYASVGRGYPPGLRPRMFATMSTAWVVPGLVGPALATLVEHAWSWRVVFLGLLPFVAVALVMAVPALRALDAAPLPADDEVGVEPERPTDAAADAVVGADVVGSPDEPVDDPSHLWRVLVLVVGVGAVLAGTSDAPVGLAVVLVVLGLPAAGWAFVGLVPPGTLRLRPGVPATVAVRGLLTCGFFAADAYVPLAITDGRGAATWVAGAALSMASVLWATGSWVQARLIDRVGPRRLDQAGFALIAASVGLMVGVAMGLPVGLAVVSWGVAGFGMGTAYSPLSLTVLAAARPGEEGSASAALQLSDTLGVAVGTGLGGSIVALGDARGWAVSSGVAVVFAASLVVLVGGLVAAGRLPERVPAQAR